MDHLDTEHKDRLGRLLGITSKMMRRTLSRNLTDKGFDLTAEQAILLWHLSADEGVTQKMMADCFDHDKVGITRWVDALENQDLVVRVPDRSDRRQKLVYLTEKGKKTCEAILPVFDLTQQQAVKGIDNERLQILKELLKAICENLGECDKSL